MSGIEPMSCGFFRPSSTKTGAMRSLTERWVSWKRSRIAGVFLRRLSLTSGKPLLLLLFLVFILEHLGYHLHQLFAVPAASLYLLAQIIHRRRKYAFNYGVRQLLDNLGVAVCAILF